MVIYFFLLYFFNLLNVFKSSTCLRSSSGSSCILCSSDYYDSNLLSFLRSSLNINNLLEENNCLPKNSSYKLSRRVFISTQNCDICNTSGLWFDQIYTNLLHALTAEHTLVLKYKEASLDIILQDGQHFILANQLQYTESEFFRGSTVEIKLMPLMRKATIYLKTNNFYLFVSGKFSVINVEFDGRDLIIYDVNQNCLFLTNLSCCKADYSNFGDKNCSINESALYMSFNQIYYYGLFNVETLFEETISELNIINCTFLKLTPLYFGFSSLIVLSPISSNIFITNVTINGSLLVNGILRSFSIDRYDQIYKNIVQTNYYLLYKQDLTKNVSILLINSLYLLHYNILLISDVQMSFPLFSFNDYYEGNFSIDKFYCNNIRNNLTIFSLLFNSNHKNTLQFYDLFAKEFGGILMDIANVDKIIIINLDIINSFNNIHLAYFEKILNITISNIYVINHTSEDYFFKISNSNININNGSIISLFTSGFILQSGISININSVIFSGILSREFHFIFLENTPLVSISSLNFINFNDFSTIIMINNGSTFIVSDTFFSKINNTLFVFYLDQLLINIYDNITVFSNSLFYLWKNDQNCQITILKNSEFFNNSFTIALYSNVALKQTFYILNSLIYQNNCSGISLFYHYWTFLTIENSSMFHNFLTSDTLSDCIISVEFSSDMIISNSYFEDNGIPFKKQFYIALTHNAFFGFWSMNSVLFSNITVVLTGLIDQISGLVNGLPLGNEFIVESSKFMILKENPHFEYKGFMVQGTPYVLLNNSIFYNILCNNRTIQHMLGSFIFMYQSASFIYTPNDYNLTIIESSFYSCRCFRGGVISVLGIFAVNLINCSFLNSTIRDFGGHLSLIASEKVHIFGTFFNVSSANEGGCLFLMNIDSVSIETVNMIDSYSKGNGGIYCKDVKLVCVTDSIVNRFYSMKNAALFYLYKSNILIKNCEFKFCVAALSGGCIFFEQTSSAEFENISVLHSSSQEGGFIYANNAKSIKILQAHFFNVSASKAGGVFFVYMAIEFMIGEAVFIENTCQGNGIILIVCEEEHSNFTVNNIVFFANKALQGSSIYYSSACQLIVENFTSFQNFENVITIIWPIKILVYLRNMSFMNQSNTGNIIFFSGIEIYASNFYFLELQSSIKSLILLESSNFSLNLSKINFVQTSFLISCHASILNISGITFINELFSSFISASATTFYATKCFFYSSNDENPLIVFSDGLLYFSNNQFAFQSSTIFLISKTEVWLFQQRIYSQNSSKDSSKVKGLIFQFNDPIIGIYHVSIIQCIFFDQGMGNSFAFEGSIIIQINSSQFFMENSSSQLICFSLHNIQYIKILNSNFTNFTQQVLDLFTNDSKKLFKVEISKSTFKENKGFCGSCLWSSGVNILLSINNSFFIHNTAIKINNKKTCSGVAAGVFFYSFSELSSFSLYSTYFINNYAFFVIPNVFSTKKINLDSSNYFFNNSDSLNFTSQLFSFPINWRLLQIPSIYSGNPLNLHLEMQDFFNQTLIFNNFSISSLLNKNQLNFPLIVLNSINSTFNGSITFSNLILKTISNQIIKLLLETDFEFLGFDFKIEPFNVIIEILNCEIGQIITKDLTCQQCPQDTYSFVYPNSSDMNQKCEICPSNMECLGRFLVFPIPGYFRLYNTSKTSFACFNFDSCLGKNVSDSEMINLTLFQYNENNYFQGICRNGSKGILCFNCAIGYGKYNEGDFCSTCEGSQLLGYLRLGGVSSLVIIYVLLIGSVNKDWNNEKNNIRDLVQMLINHNQMFLIMAQSISSYSFLIFKDYFNSIASFFFINQKVFLNDCLILELLSKEPSSLYFPEKIFILALPLLMSMICFFLLLLLRIIKQSFKAFFVSKIFTFSKFGLSLQSLYLEMEFYVLFVIFTFFPMILRSCLGSFNCFQLDPEKPNLYLKSNPDIVCFAKSHLENIIKVIIPGLILYGVCFPVYLFLVMKRFKTQKTMRAEIRKKMIDELKKESSRMVLELKRANTDSHRLEKKMKKFSFFSKGFKPKFYYLECIFLFRKFLLIFICTFNEFSISDEYKFVIVSFICLFSFSFISKCNPYIFFSMNTLENFSLWVYVGFTVSALFFNSSVNTQVKNIIAIGIMVVHVIYILFAVFLFMSQLVWCFQGVRRVRQAWRNKSYI